MPTRLLFTDGSVHTETRIGYGAYLSIDSDEALSDDIATEVKTKRFADTSSSRLELQTLLWALDEVGKAPSTIIIHSDSQNIIGLPNRRKRLESNDFVSASGTPLANHGLYRSFFESIDRIRCQFVKVRGHARNDGRSDIESLFAIVDKAARAALRNDRKQ